MSIVLYHHPFSRAAGVVWMLEELGVAYQLRFVDIFKGAHKAPEMVAMNPMGKLPILADGETVVTESAAIGLYLADRYALGKLAPATDDPARATYLRWSLFSPSVVEPGVLAKASKWDVKPSQVGWGEYDAMLKAMASAIEGREYILGDRFSMADCIFGGTLRFMLRVKMLEPTPVFAAYNDRIGARAGFQRAEAKNLAVAKEHGLNHG